MFGCGAMVSESDEGGVHSMHQQGSAWQSIYDHAVNCNAAVHTPFVGLSFFLVGGGFLSSGTLVH